MSSRAGALALTCAILTVVHTWPMAAAPHRYSRIDNADYLLNAWAISWVAHQGVTDPLRLFDGNIFWPERSTLAYSEAMIVQGVMAAPVRALGGSPVLAFNAVMLAGYFLTSLAFGLLAYRWTGSWAAAFVTASAAGFNSHLFTRMAQLQAMHVEFIALALFGLDRIFTRGRIRDAVTLGVGFALQGLTSIYLLVFTSWAMVFAGLTRFVTAGRGRRGRPAILAALAAGVALLLLSFYLDAYYRVHLDQGFRADQRRQHRAGRLLHRLSQFGLVGPLLVESAVCRGQPLHQLPGHHRAAAGRRGRRLAPGPVEPARLDVRRHRRRLRGGVGRAPASRLRARARPGPALLGGARAGAHRPGGAARARPARRIRRRLARAPVGRPAGLAGGGRDCRRAHQRGGAAGPDSLPPFRRHPHGLRGTAA